MPRKKNIPAGDPYWKDKYQKQNASGESVQNTKRQKARQMYDAAGIDRTGKDIDHKKALRNGGSAGRSNLRLRDSSTNQADNGHHPGEKAGKKTK